MSLAEVDQKIEALWKEAERTQASMARLLAEVNSDSKLSEEGKREEAANLKAGHKNKLTELRDTEKQLVDDAILNLERKIDSRIGNTASDIIAFRDAQDRAERLENSDDAQRLMKRAIVTEDKSLAHAVFRRSLESGYKAAVKIFTDSYPDLVDVVGDLNNLTTFRDQNFQRTMRYAA